MVFLLNSGGSLLNLGGSLLNLGGSLLNFGGSLLNLGGSLLNFGVCGKRKKQTKWRGLKMSTKFGHLSTKFLQFLLNSGCSLLNFCPNL